MKKIYSFVFLLLVCVGCTSSVEQSDLQHLNGYWEIEKVTQPKGKEVDFSMNTIYDYYEIDQNHKGFYKKASPQLDGTFMVDDYQEEIKVSQKDNEFILKFHSEFNDREVIITELSSHRFSFINQDNKTYFYKRAEPLNIINNEQ